MRAYSIALAVIAVVACSKSKETSNAVAPGSGSATGSAPAPAAGSAAKAAPPAADAYDTHMKSGEALEDQRKWSDALGEFEAALVAKPGDARALTEVGFTAYFADKLDRAKEASLAAVAAAKDDKKLRGAALFNLGLSVEKTMPHAASALYSESLKIRPNRAVRARLAKLQANKDASKPTPDGDALLAKVDVKPAPPPAAAPSSSPASPIDQQMFDALEAAGVEWNSGAGKSVLDVENLECHENHQVKPTTYECTAPPTKGKAAKAIIDNLVARKIAPTKEHGDMVTYKVSSVRCRTFNEGESGAPDACDVNP